MADGAMTRALAYLVLLGLFGVAAQRAGIPAPEFLRFRDVTGQSGISFVHKSDHTPDKFLIETMGSGVAWIDYDCDGLADLFLLNGAQISRTGDRIIIDKSEPDYWNRLYRNLGDGKFSDVTAATGIQGTTFAMGVATGDIDNDGWPDVYVTGWERNALYRNEAGKSFREITATAGVEAGGWSVGAAFLDYDRDGLLDLFVSRYLDWSFENNPWCGPREPERRGYCHPNSFGDVRHLLYRNLGNGRFKDVSRQTGIADHPGKGLGVAVADLDQDGWIDILVANDSVAQQVFRNNGDGTFSDIGLEAGVAYNADGKAFAGMGIDVADYDNDGRPELFINALSLEGYALFKSSGPGIFDSVSEQSGLRRASDPFGGWGTRLADFDNDGYKDLFVAQGHVMDTIHHDNPKLSYRQPMLLLRNTGGKFVDVSASAGSALRTPRAARGAAIADFDNDGRLDLVVNNNDESPLLLKNESPERNWLAVDLIGTKSNRDAIGAVVKVTDTAGRKQWQTVSTASSYLSASQRRVHFGLGDAEAVAEVEVHWPAGGVQLVRKPGINRALTIRESQ
jgi:hypothetical protein